MEKHKKQQNWNSTKWWLSKLYGKKPDIKRELLLLLLLLLLLFTVIEFSPGGSNPYTSTDKTNKNKYI